MSFARGSSRRKAPEILGSKHMARFLKEVDRVYDWVLIDTSPILAVSDAATLAVMVDGAVLVVSGAKRDWWLSRGRSNRLWARGESPRRLLSKFDAQKAYGGFLRRGQIRVPYDRLRKEGRNQTAKTRRKRSS